MNPDKYLEPTADIPRTRIKRGKSQGPYNFGAVGIRADGLVVSPYNVGLPTVRCPEGHAEIRLSKKLGSGAVVFVARVKDDGTWTMGKPCKACETKLRNLRVRKVFYTIGPKEYGVMDLEG